MSVYLVRALGTNLYKIGRSKLVAERIRQMQPGCPHRLHVIRDIVGDDDVEARIQQHCAPFHYRGEWYEFETVGSAVTEFMVGLMGGGSIATPDDWAEALRTEAAA